MIFQTNYDEIQLKKISYDVISVMSSPLRHHHVTEKCYQYMSQIFSNIFPPPTIKISGYASGNKTENQVFLQKRNCTNYLIFYKMIEVCPKNTVGHQFFADLLMFVGCKM